jgi:hypothetical protein
VATAGRIDVITAVWGEWHTNAFVSACLPSLLAEGNLPALAAQHSCRYCIITDRRSAEAIQASPAFRRVREVVEPSLNILEDEHFFGTGTSAAVANQSSTWGRQIERSKLDQSKIILMGPDIVTADGSLAHIGALFEAGERAIFTKAIRSIDETCRPCLAAFADPDGATRIDSRSLVRLTIEHLHPLVGEHLLGNERFAAHSELLLQPIPGEGFAMRVLASEVFAFDSKQVPLDQWNAPVIDFAPAMVLDSDDFFQTSLTPLYKDADWYYLPYEGTPVAVARWWLVHDNEIFDALARKTFVCHVNGADGPRWQQADETLTRFLALVEPRKNLLRIWWAIRLEPDLSLMRSILAAAVFGTHGNIGLGASGPVTLFLPDDRTLGELSGWFLDALLAGERIDVWQAFMSAMVVPGSLTANGSGRAVGRTLAGVMVELVRTPEGLRANDIRLVDDGRIARGGHKIYRLASGGMLAGPLAQSAGRTAGDSVERGIATRPLLK